MEAGRGGNTGAERGGNWENCTAGRIAGTPTGAGKTGIRNWSMVKLLCKPWDWADIHLVSVSIALS